MISINQLLDETRQLTDETVSHIVQSATEDLFHTGRLARNAMLGDNVIDLIIGNLPNAVGAGGVATMMTVLNLVADPAAKVGSVDPIQGGTKYLTRFKTGENAEPLPIGNDPNDQFSGDRREFEFLTTGPFIAVRIPYKTDEYQVTSDGAILIASQTVEAGFLCFLTGPSIPEGRFESPSDSAIQNLVEKGGTRKPASQEKKQARELLIAAMNQLTTKKVVSRIKVISACNPIPNFLRSENWPKIANIIQEWLDANPE